MELFGLYLNQNVWLLILGVVLLLSFLASNRVQRTFDRYKNEQAASGVTADAMAQQLLAAHNSAVVVTPVNGSLTDHYNSKTATVGLSTQVYGQASVSALAVAAHEIGHVMQYEEGYAPIRFRNTILPVAQFGSAAGPWIIILGAFISSYTVAMIGLGLYAALFIFQLVTLPVEFNASAHGLEMLEQGNYLSAEQLPDAKKVLRAAAMTYVLAAVGSFVSLLRFLSIINRSTRRN